jgi:hypothetical protein
MKKLLFILFTLFLILTSCEVNPIDKQLPENTEPITVYDIEIGKFPGEKYTTFFASFTNKASGKVISDSYDPLKNTPGEQPYLLQYSNQNIDQYTFTYNNKTCAGYSLDKSAMYIEFYNDFCPYFLLKYKGKPRR